MLKKIINGKHTQAVIAQAGPSGLAIISFMILARVFSKEDFGQWALYVMLITIVDLIKSGLVETALIKYSSGCDKDEKNEVIGSSWLLNIVFVISLLIISQLILFLEIFEIEGAVLFLIYYPLYGIFSMPYFYFIWNNQVLLDFKKIVIVKLINSFIFLSVCISSFFLKFNLEQIILFNILGFSITSIICLFWGQTGWNKLLMATKVTVIKCVNFGKYHMLSYLGTNVLKSSDTFLIGAFLGPAAIAVYSIPKRLMLLVHTPLTSAVSVAFPILSADDNKGNKMAFKNNLEKYIGVLTIFYIPFIFILFLFSRPLVLMLGGAKYEDAVIIFQLFLLYSAFLPFDRLTGVALDAMGLPKLNFYKVLIMSIVNIVGDVIVLYYFRSIELVALVTLFTVLSGIITGYILVKRKINIELKSILIAGVNAFIEIVEKRKLEFSQRKVDIKTKTTNSAG